MKVEDVREKEQNEKPFWYRKELDDLKAMREASRLWKPQPKRK